MKRMFADGEDVFYYSRSTTKISPCRRMPEGVEEGNSQGLYRFKAQGKIKNTKRTSSAQRTDYQIRFARQEILAEKYGVSADVWSATNYKQMRNDRFLPALDMLHPTRRRENPTSRLFGEGKGRVRCCF